MPGVQNWIDKPLDVIQNIIDRLPEGAKEIDAVKEYFAKQLKAPETLAWVPSINSQPLQDVPSESMVRYRCMVQDMFNSELFLAQYKVTNTRTAQVLTRSGYFKDVNENVRDEVFDVHSPDTKTDERLMLYCVPVPGESFWVKSEYAKQSIALRAPPSPDSTTGGTKRSHDEMEEEEEEAVLVEHVGNGGWGPFVVEEAEEQNGAGALNPPEAGAGAAARPLPDLNFPLPGEQGPAVLVKVYGDQDQLKVNDMIEVVGVLSMDPSLAAMHDDPDEQDAMNPAERAVHNPPPSLVPRLHAVLVKKLDHNNPLVSPNPPKYLGKEAIGCREELTIVLEHSVMGDTLAAEYLMCHLMSSVYARADMMPLGKLAVNMSGPATRGLAPLFYQLISSLTPQSHLLPLSLGTLNSVLLSPYKDYDLNRLRSGQLQLASGTHLVLDETAMDNGQLDTRGVHNVTALGNVIQWQKVTYDFQFHTQDFVTDLPVIVLSEGESFLPKDIHVPLCPTSVPADLSSYFEHFSANLTDELMERLRAYITHCRGIKYSISDEIQKTLQEEFVKARRDDPSVMTIEDFHRILSLVRLYTLSFCQADCSPEIIAHVIEMEQERKARLAQAPAQAHAQPPAQPPAQPTGQPPAAHTH